MVTFKTIHARCSGGERHPISQLRVDLGSYLTSGHFGSKRAQEWTSLPATTEELCCYGYFRDHSRSFFGWVKAPEITATGRSRAYLTSGHFGSKRAQDWSSLPATTEKLCCYGYFRDLWVSCSGGGRHPRSQLRVNQGSYLTCGHFGSKRAQEWTSLPATTEELCCYGYFRNHSRSLFRWGKAPEITSRSGPGVLSY
jgi:hypothetical protein